MGKGIQYFATCAAVACGMCAGRANAQTDENLPERPTTTSIEIMHYGLEKKAYRDNIADTDLKLFVGDDGTTTTKYLPITLIPAEKSITRTRTNLLTGDSNPDTT